jgi:riboflavin synthase
MFTGIVRERGRLVGEPVTVPGGGAILRVGHSRELGELLEVGASVSVSGVCLTVTRQEPEVATFDLAPETLRRTTLGGLGAGDEVNLEPPLRMGDPLGGHWVQGHVDGTLEVRERRDLEAHRELVLSLPGELEPYVVEKGSVALDGVSLTVSARRRGELEVALVPHTLEVTTLGAKAPGDRLNVEVDILSKYVVQALAARGEGPK